MRMLDDTRRGEPAGWPAPPGGAAVPWVLALNVSSPWLHCLLSNGLDRFEHACCEWPPRGAAASLPSGVQALLATAPMSMLRLQLDAGLDPWPWEEEIERLGGPRALSRHLAVPAGTQREAHGPPGEPLGTPSRDDPRWLQVPLADAAQYALQVGGRPLLLLSDRLPSAQALGFRLALQQHWTPQHWLSEATARAAADCAVPRSEWRLYGDAAFLPHQGASEAQWRLVTTLSIDLVRSTDRLDEWGAEHYAVQHAAFHRLCREQVEGFGGRLDDPRGNDGWMAYFGLTQAQEDSAARAVLAGDALIRLAPALGFSIRMGVASGRVAVSDGQPFGMEVHLAARLQALAPVDGMMVSETTDALLGPGVSRERLGPFELRGFKVPQWAWRVRAVSSPLHAARQRIGPARFVGRERELGLLHEAWREVCSRGHGLYRCVIGEPGIGKSRLFSEFEQMLSRDDDAVIRLRVAGRAEMQSSAFAALSLALQGPSFAPLAERLHAASRPDENAPEHLGQQQRRQLIDGLIDGLLALANKTPLCVVVDDAQWLDPSSIELVERLRQAAQAVPLLLLVGLRDDPRSLARGPHTIEPIELPALDLEASLELLGALSAGAPLPEDLRRHIAQRAGGVPLFLEETVRMVQARPDPTSVAEHAIPATLDELLVARLEALGEARPLAQLAAVLGAEFPAALWDAVREEPDGSIRRAQQGGAWLRLLASGLILPDGAEPPASYRFKHALIRDAAYESLWANERRRLHGIVAGVLERRPQEARAALELRAHHLAAAGQLEAAFGAWTLAARQAAGAAADREAVALVQCALALLPSLPDTAAVRQQALQLHLLEAARHIALDGYGAASVESAYLRAAALCSTAHDSAMRTRVELGLEACYAMRGDLARARALAEAAVRATNWEPNRRLALQARWAWINVVFHQGHAAQALAMADECLARYEPGLHQPRAVQDPAVMCLSYSAWGLFECGRAGQALLRVQRLLELAATLDHPFSHAVAHGFAASVHLFRGEHERGLEHAEEALRRCTASAFQVWGAHAHIMRGRLRAALGAPQEGLAEMEQGLELWMATGARITCATYLAFQAEVCLQLGRPQDALRRLLLAQDIAQRHGEHYHEAELLRLLGCSQWQLRQDEADVRAAQSLLERALVLARAQGKLGFALRSAHALAGVRAAKGDTAGAILCMEEALDAVPDHHLTSDARQAMAALREWRSGAAAP